MSGAVATTPLNVAYHVQQAITADVGPLTITKSPADATDALDVVVTGGTGLAAKFTGASVSIPGSGANSERLGAGATSTGLSSTVLGQGTSDGGFTGVVCLGRGATAAAANQLVGGSSATPLSDVWFGKGFADAAPTLWVLHGTRVAAATADTAGGGVRLQPGESRGAAVGGPLEAYLTAAGAAGTTLNVATKRFELLGAGGANFFQTDGATAIFRVSNVGAFDLVGVAADPAVSAVGEARWIYNTTTGTIRTSKGGAAYSDLVVTNVWTRTGTTLAPTTANDSASVPDSGGLNSEKWGAGATAGFAGATAVGNAATAGGMNATALGRSSNAAGAGGVAIGQAATSTSGVSVGQSTSSQATAVAVGPSANAGTTDSIAIGRLATTSIATDVVAIGRQSAASATGGIAIGVGANANGVNSIAIGVNASAGGFTPAVAIGGGTATANNQLVVGSAAYALNAGVFGNGVTSATPLGFTIRPTGGLGLGVAGGALNLAGGQSGDAATAGGAVTIQTSRAGTGTTSTVAVTVANDGTISDLGSGGSSERFGAAAAAGGLNSTAVGNSATANGSGATVVGQGSSGVANANATVVGQGSSVSGAGSTVVGQGAVGAANDAVLGQAATGSGTCVAVGQSANASGFNAVAVGRSAAAIANTVALGLGATTTAANQFVCGSATLTISDLYFGNGVTNAAPAAATIHGSGGLGAAIAGAALNLAGGTSGDAATAGGAINLKVSLGGSGTASTTVWSIANTGNWVAGADNTYNVGASATTFRPATGFFGTGVNVANGTTLTTGTLTGATSLTLATNANNAINLNPNGTGNVNVNTAVTGGAFVVTNNAGAEQVYFGANDGVNSPNSMKGPILSVGVARQLLQLIDTTAFAAGVGGFESFAGKVDGAGSLSDFAHIGGVKENGTSGNLSGALVMAVRPGPLAANTPVEYLRITSAGQIQIGGLTTGAGTKGTITWNTALGPITQLAGPTDQPLVAQGGTSAGGVGLGGLISLGSSAGGAGGNVTVTAGDAGSFAGAGGSIIWNTGQAVGANASGDFTLNTKAGSVTLGTRAGNINLQCADGTNGNSAGGSFVIRAGLGAGTGANGSISFQFGTTEFARWDGATKGQLVWGSAGAITHALGPGDAPFKFSTQTNQNLVLAPNGTGKVDLSSNSYLYRNAFAAKTANYSVLTGDGGTVFSNAGAAGAVNFTLPTAAAGLTYTFVVEAAQTLQVTAGAATTIRLAGSVSAAAGNVTNATIGGVVILVATSATTWVATSIVGTWTVT